MLTVVLVATSRRRQSRSTAAPIPPKKAIEPARRFGLTFVFMFAETQVTVTGAGPVTVNLEGCPAPKAR